MSVDRRTGGPGTVRGAGCEFSLDERPKRVKSEWFGEYRTPRMFQETFRVLASSVVFPYAAGAITT